MLRVLAALPLIVVLVIFALSNRTPVSVGFLGYSILAPLSVAILIGAAIFFLLGALIVWFGALRQRRRAWRAERRVKELEVELEGLRKRPLIASPVRRCPGGGFLTGDRAPRSRLIAALDTADRDEASDWARAVAPHCGLLKLGLEFFAAHGPEGVAAIEPQRLFLDLKLHDIPNTVAAACRAVGRLGPAMLTVHASGGAAMVAAARDALETASAGGRRTALLAVTVLTSLDAEALHALGVDADPAAQALRLGRIAIDAGADGLVCSPHEVGTLRAALGSGVCLVVPGIRPAGSAAGDQARIMTPREAVDAGADWIVVGRPITTSADPADAARRIAAEIGVR